MRRGQGGRRLATAGVGSMVVLAVGLTGSAVQPAQPAHAEPAAAGAAIGLVGRTGTTTALEKKRVDSVATPRLNWYKCYDIAECATVRLPLDYDKPRGATTELAVLRVKARNQKAKLGSLFVNPGGPGGSATEFARFAPAFLSNAVLDRFDIVGVDPRGVGASQRLECFRSVKDQTAAFAGLGVAFPFGAKEERAYVTSAEATGRACSTTGKPLAGAMSTAEVARDMEVMRRAVGDKKLTYLGFSYGSALGQYYANMFPDRFRAVAVDGIINPITWVGTRWTRDQIQDDRLRSADGAYRALREILRRCDKAGARYCAFAAGNPTKNFDVLAQRLKAKPIDLGEGLVITYADFIGGVLGDLYLPGGGDAVTTTAANLWAASSPSVTVLARDRARVALRKQIAEARRQAAGRDFPYDNSFEATSGVACTDGLHPADARSWPALTAKADRRARYFGRAWGWASVQCARSTWTVRDEDAYRGPFSRRTVAPVLVVGNYWDPATNYDEAVASARLLPNSRLLSSTNWGHTAYGTSACATRAIDTYLLRGTLPAGGTVCVGDEQPFTEPLERDSAAAKKAKAMRADGSKQLPPVAVRVPDSVLNGTR